MTEISQVFTLCILFLSFYFGRCKEYKVYWNMPSFQCKGYNMNFTYAVDEYGFTMNEDDNFKGEKITLLYDPGMFPTIYNFSLEDQNLEDLQLVNNGLPQNGDIMIHLNAFEKEINRDINDTYYNGLVIIDMEQWGATWHQNFNHMEVYQIMTKQEIMDKYPNATNEFIESEAKKTYERAATRFLFYTLVYAKALRPYAKWGYYQYPQCFNSPGVDVCSNSTQEDNNQMILLWRFSDAVYPSLYLDVKGTPDERALQIKGMVREGFRVTKYSNKTLLNIPYIWYKYHGNTVIQDEDLVNLLTIPKEEGANGVIMWGASADFDSEEKCVAFKNYLDTTMGPAVKKVVQKA